MKISLYQPQFIFEDGQRGNQEDYIWPAPGRATADDRLFIVCDGMGGHEHGEVASRTFANGLAEYFNEHVAAGDVVTDDVLSAAIAHAYTLLDAEDDGNYKRMGTTLTLLYFHGGGVLAAHIGDSRIYHLRPGKGLLYVSRDHSLVFDLYRSGEISLEEIKTSPNKNVITRAVQPGEDRRTRPDVVHITDVEPGDYFYLCSDGMLEQMENDELFDLITGPDTDEDKIARLIRETDRNRDNHSAYLIRVSDVLHEPGDVDDGGEEERTTVYNALNMRPINDERESSDNVTGGDDGSPDLGTGENEVDGDRGNSPSDNQPRSSFAPTAADHEDSLPSQAKASRKSRHLIYLLIAAVLGILAAVGTLFWSIRHNSNKHSGQPVKQEEVKPSIRIQSIDPSLVPQADDDNDEGGLNSDGSQDNLGSVESTQPAHDAQGDEALHSIPKWQSEIFFE